MKYHKFRDFIEEVKRRTDIVQVIGQYISLDLNNKALCPFHEDKNPSFSVNPEGQYFHCFGCGRGGDVFKFLELMEKKTFMEALSELAEQADVSLSGLTTEGMRHIKEDRVVDEILTETASFYHKSLAPEVKQYLVQERGFNDEVISQSRIGKASWWALGKFR